MLPPRTQVRQTQQAALGHATEQISEAMTHLDTVRLGDEVLVLLARWQNAAALAERVRDAAHTPQQLLWRHFRGDWDGEGGEGVGVGDAPLLKHLRQAGAGGMGLNGRMCAQLTRAFIATPLPKLTLASSHS